MHTVTVHVRPIEWRGRERRAARISFSDKFVQSDTRTLCERRFKRLFGESIPPIDVSYYVTISRKEDLRTGFWGESR